jgi:rod shape-determining protein MreD
MNRFRKMRAVAKIALLLASIVVVQGIFSYWFSLFRYFDLPLIYCIYYGFTRARPIGSVVVGSALGLMQDSLAGVPLGTNGFSKTLVAFLAASTGSKFDVDQTITRVIALILFTFLDSVLKVVAGAASGAGPGGVPGPGFGDLLLSALCNLLLGVIFFGYRDRPDDATA